MRRVSLVTWWLLVVLTLAVAGLTHIAEVLALPWRDADDAFARVSTLVRPGARATLPAPDEDGPRLPGRDPAMLTAICRFDLAMQPFRLVTSPFSESFVTIGFHSRHGLAFYGLMVRATDASSLELALVPTVGSRDGGDAAQGKAQIAVSPPEPEGFVTLSTPLGDGSEREEAEQRLQHFQCRWQAAAP